MNVLQPWVMELTLMQQSVLLTSLRGPDGIEKNHVSKLLIRWLRRCVLLSAFDKRVLENPYDPGGGSFTGPSLRLPHDDTFGLTAQEFSDNEHAKLFWDIGMNRVLKQYISTLDSLPHHFQLHFMHAAEIIGYKHPNTQIANWWRHVYYELAYDMHLQPEPKDVMEHRLADIKENWEAHDNNRAENP